MRRSTILRTVLLAVFASMVPAEAVGSAGIEPYRATRPPQPFLEPADERERLRRMLDRALPITWVFTGDSITHGAKHTHGWRSYCQHFEERVRWELHKVSDFVINTGISGQRAREVLSSFDDRVTRFAPAAVFLLVGMNDAKDGVSGRGRFRTDLAELVDRVRQLGAVPVLQTANPIDVEHSPDREDLPAYMDIIRSVAEERAVFLIDHHVFWESQSAGVIDDWLSDPIHPNERGHHEYAKKIFVELSIFDPASPTCSLEIP